MVKNSSLKLALSGSFERACPRWVTAHKLQGVRRVYIKSQFMNEKERALLKLENAIMDLVDAARIT